VFLHQEERQVHGAGPGALPRAGEDVVGDANHLRREARRLLDVRTHPQAIGQLELVYQLDERKAEGAHHHDGLSEASIVRRCGACAGDPEENLTAGRHQVLDDADHDAVALFVRRDRLEATHEIGQRAHRRLRLAGAVVWGLHHAETG